MIVQDKEKRWKRKMKKKKKIKETILIKGGYRALKDENIHHTLMEIGRGVGSPKPKKGKGSYRRKKIRRDDYQ